MDRRTLAWLCLGAVVLFSSCGESKGARVLAVFPFPSRSHGIVFTAISRALGERGHEVTVLQAFPDKDTRPNVNVIPIGNIMEELLNKDVNFFTRRSGPISGMLHLILMGKAIVNGTLRNANVQEVINKPGQKFDLILTELFFCQEALMGLGHKFKAPVVAVNPFGTYFLMDEVVGNPTNPAYIPNIFLDHTDTMSFVERFINTVYFVFSKITLEFYHHPAQQALLTEFFPDAPPLKQLLQDRLALTLINNHHTLFYPAPLSPNVIEVGGMHIRHTVNPLPKSLQDFMDSSKDGVILFSLGSNVKMVHMEPHKKEALFSTFGALKMNVIMKWDGPVPENLPANIRLEEWLPQSDLLRHPNLRLFVTHGGLLSTQEAMFNGVPLIGMPVFADQHFNMRTAVLKGVAVQVDVKTLTRETLSSALREVLDNPKYAQTAKKVSGVFRSQPLKPINQAMFWIEHVLEHGWEHLRPSSTQLSWFQLLLLDVLAVAMLPVLLLLLCCRAVCCRRKSKAANPSASRSKKKN